jgi:hypothetical protein
MPDPSVPGWKIGEIEVAHYRKQVDPFHRHSPKREQMQSKNPERNKSERNGSGDCVGHRMAQGRGTADVCMLRTTYEQVNAKRLSGGLYLCTCRICGTLPKFGTDNEGWGRNRCELAIGPPRVATTPIPANQRVSWGKSIVHIANVESHKCEILPGATADSARSGSLSTHANPPGSQHTPSSSAVSGPSPEKQQSL